MGPPGQPGGLTTAAAVDRSALVATVRAELDALPQGLRCIVATSGGPDSCALLDLVCRARPDLRALAAHVRHGLRDDAVDAAAAAAQARALHIVLRTVAVDVVVAGQGPEASARAARYEALSRVAAEEGAQAVLVGHTADDQAETVLLNLGRGTGLRGLAAMAVRSPRQGTVIWRPLLRLRRADVRAHAESLGLPIALDPSNADAGQRRQRVRSEVLPALARLSGGDGDPVRLLCRLADLARADADLLDGLTRRLARRHLVVWGPSRAVRADIVDALPPALASRLVRRLLAGARGRSAGLGAAAVAEALALREGGARSAPGDVLVTRGQGWLAAAPRHPGPWKAPLGDLAQPVELVPLGVRLVSAPPSGHSPLPPRRPGTGDRHAVAMLRSVRGGAVRAWAAGDRLGEHGPALSDLLRDAGVPRAVRPHVPVIVDAAGVPAWIPGVALRPDAAPDDGPGVWVAPL